MRSTGDRGLDSTLINIPRNLGGPAGVPMEIYTVLCGRVPCVPKNNGSLDILTNTVQYSLDPAQTRPFFMNPTRAAPRPSGVEARSWRTDSTTSSNSTTVNTDGCENVPVRPRFDVDPAAPADGGTTEAGKPSAQDVMLHYPQRALVRACPSPATPTAAMRTRTSGRRS